ncbi:peptidase, S49 family protein [Escherichia coli O121 str. RM8352]|nr:peptidase, S49 family protein [Escherichia coli O121 str. RM8352]
MTGYNGIIARLQQAASDPMVDGILLDMDTPAGWWREHLTVLTSSPVCET